MKDDSDIDDILNEIEKDTVEVETSDILETTHVTEEGVIDLEDDKSLSSAIIKNSLDVIKDAKRVFTSISDDVLHGKDSSTSSKEAMIKALDVQNAANANMINLAKVISSKKQVNNGVVINTMSPKSANINLDKIKGIFSKEN